MTQHFCAECRAQFESRLHTEVIERNYIAIDRHLNATWMPRMRDTPKRKEKKKGKKKSSGVTHHYNTKTNKKYYNQ